MPKQNWIWFGILWPPNLTQLFAKTKLDLVWKCSSICWRFFSKLNLVWFGNTEWNVAAVRIYNNTNKMVFFEFYDGDEQYQLAEEEWSRINNSAERQSSDTAILRPLNVFTQPLFNMFLLSSSICFHWKPLIVFTQNLSMFSISLFNMFSFSSSSMCFHSDSLNVFTQPLQCFHSDPL